MSILSGHFIEGISQIFIFIPNISRISGILDYSAAQEIFFTDLMVKCTLLCEGSSMREFVKAVTQNQKMSLWVKWSVIPLLGLTFIFFYNGGGYGGC